MNQHQENSLSIKDLLPTSPFALQTLPSLFISHGSPIIALENNATTQAMNKIGQNLPKPKLIIMMSAHWQSQHLEINGNPAPATWHDFNGFPSELYQIDYPAKSEPDVAESLAHQLQSLGIQASVNRLRPFDHGVWTPLMHLYPQADVPIVQISLPYHFDSYACYQLGAVFSSLRQEQVLIIGSGSVTHNLRQVRFDSCEVEDETSEFKHWLINQLKHDKPKALDWASHPLAKHNHPTPEHLLPLFFAMGAGDMMSVVHESFAHYSLGMDIYRFD
ncbi:MULTISPECIES: DODA-type extradiol aromatic ring-opening family dioxygenase [unclassified Moraxella]|uniref:DODA-type extradiol aromatic ring-opening family dioxygenase n=1 Tax=unclassified Moraxella TaxID=2685852 RepID=UPI003AF81E0D